jgi:putative restriction endonuclease
MNFWWVSHSQTFRHEFFGKYIWSPKRKRNYQINPFYETMREVTPGDIVYSFADGAVQGFGIARTRCYTSPRPDEFGHIGQAWNEVGWRVDIDFKKFTEPILPPQHMHAIAPTLPERYSPIRANGYGNQGVYLAQNSPANGTRHCATGVNRTLGNYSRPAIFRNGRNAVAGIARHRGMGSARM